jgi:hypothetical protein
MTKPAEPQPASKIPQERDLKNIHDRQHPSFFDTSRKTNTRQTTAIMADEYVRPSESLLPAAISRAVPSGHRIRASPELDIPS